MGSQGMDAFNYAIKSNEAWANYKGHQNPTFFEKLSQGQSPKILWIGCCDSRVPPEVILGLQPGDVFVHRNIANVYQPNDLSALAAIEYAVVHLGVEHVILAGHTGCGGAKAALGDGRVGDNIEAWIGPLRALKRANEAELKAIGDEDQRAVRLAELNVEMGVNALLINRHIEEGVKSGKLSVHGVIFEIECGKLRDLKLGTGKLGADGASDDIEIVKGNHGMLSFSGDVAKMVIR